LIAIRGIAVNKVLRPPSLGDFLAETPPLAPTAAAASLSAAAATLKLLGIVIVLWPALSHGIEKELDEVFAEQRELVAHLHGLLGHYACKGRE
jgi:hypothetical protein